MLLKNNLATFYADTGQFKDILSRPHDPPFLYLHFWLLDDLPLAGALPKALFERGLFLALLFSFAAAATQDTILDDGANFDSRYLFLAQTLLRQADHHLAELHLPSSPFWLYHRSAWHEYSEAMLTHAGPHLPVSMEALAGKLAFSKIPAAAVALAAGDDTGRVSQLCAMLDQLNAIWQTLRDLSTFRQDLSRRRYTYPIRKTLQEAGLDPEPLPDPEQMLGALVLTQTVEKIGQEALHKLETCQAVADALSLPSFSPYFAALNTVITELMALFSLKAKPVERNQKRPIFAPHVDPLPKVIDMAGRYLLADLTFRESWEVQRRGIFGADEVIAKAFPAGLVVELLCQHGHAMAGPIEQIFNTLQETGFRYYNHPHLPPDTDDLALLLRLYSYSPEPDRHRQILQKPLRWLEQSLGQAGEIPVWLNQGEAAHETEKLPVSLWGNSCTTVQANLLLGLIDYDWEGYRELIEKAAWNMCEQLLARGLSAASHYVPPYSLWTTFHLISWLTARPISPLLQAKLQATAQALIGPLRLEARQYHLSPQTAAFLTLTCLSTNAAAQLKPLFEPAWITLLCKQQRYDGSWPAEALFGTPTRGEIATWYASNTVTTAFCYHALKKYRLVPSPGGEG